MITVYLYYFEENDSLSRHTRERLAGQRLLLYGLKDLYNIEESQKGLEEITSTIANGKPVLPDGYPHFNVSHSSGFVVCALSDQPVGADIETVRPFRELVLKKTFSQRENAFYKESITSDPSIKNELFFRFWTLKESAIKYTGQGLRQPLTDFEFSPVCTKEPINIEETHSNDILFSPVTSNHSDLSFSQALLGSPHYPDDFIISVCSKMPEGPLAIPFASSEEIRKLPPALPSERSDEIQKLPPAFHSASSEEIPKLPPAFHSASSEEMPKLPPALSDLCSDKQKSERKTLRLIVVKNI